MEERDHANVSRASRTCEWRLPRVGVFEGNDCSLKVRLVCSPRSRVARSALRGPSVRGAREREHSCQRWGCRVKLALGGGSSGEWPAVEECKTYVLRRSDNSQVMH